jgi:glutathione peroxidase
MKTFVLMMVSLLFAISSEAQNKSFYDFTVKTIDGKDFPLSSLKGKKVLVVNVASKCGLTPQYAQLEKLYEKYKEKDFVIIGFPANNFMGQEPGSNEEIAKFCSLNYDVTFPMMAKISVKGKDMAPLYQWLTEKKQNDPLGAGESMVVFRRSVCGKVAGQVFQKLWDQGVVRILQ